MSPQLISPPSTRQAETRRRRRRSVGASWMPRALKAGAVRRRAGGPSSPARWCCSPPVTSAALDDCALFRLRRRRPAFGALCRPRARTSGPPGEEGVLRVARPRRPVRRDRMPHSRFAPRQEPEQGRSFRVPAPPTRARTTRASRLQRQGAAGPTRRSPSAPGLADGPAAQAPRRCVTRRAPVGDERAVVGATSGTTWARSTTGPPTRRRIEGRRSVLTVCPDAKGRVSVTAQVPLTKAWLEVIGEDKSTRTLPLIVGEGNQASGTFRVQRRAIRPTRCI